jgi:fluoride ion exporter CrcB/FEX
MKNIINIREGIKMNVSQFLNTSTSLGTFIIGICSSLVAGVMLGFFTGKSYQKKISNKVKQKGDGNINIVDSNIEGSFRK